MYACVRVPLVIISRDDVTYAGNSPPPHKAIHQTGDDGHPKVREGERERERTNMSAAGPPVQ